jgi:hypothetical protein
LQDVVGGSRDVAFILSGGGSIRLHIGPAIAGRRASRAQGGRRRQHLPGARSRASGLGPLEPARGWGGGGPLFVYNSTPRQQLGDARVGGVSDPD